MVFREKLVAAPAARVLQEQEQPAFVRVRPDRCFAQLAARFLAPREDSVQTIVKGRWHLLLAGAWLAAMAGAVSAQGSDAGKFLSVAGDVRGISRDWAPRAARRAADSLAGGAGGHLQPRLRRHDEHPEQSRHRFARQPRSDRLRGAAGQRGTGTGSAASSHFQPAYSAANDQAAGRRTRGAAN